MFLQRALTGVIGLPILFGLLYLDGLPWAFGLPLLTVVAVVSVLGSDEFLRLLRKRGFAPPPDTGKMMGALPPLFIYFYRYPYNDTVLLALTLIIVVDVLMLALALIGDISRRMAKQPQPAGAAGRGQPALAGGGKLHNPRQDAPASILPAQAGGTLGALRDFALMALGAAYVGGSLSYLILLRRIDPLVAPPGGVWPVMLLIAAVWISDTAAYAAGKHLDGPKLWPRVSPGKTIVGTVAGIVACAIIFAVACVTRSLGSSPRFVAAVAGAAAAIGAAIALAGLGGDLAESALKRWAGVKDSGAILPGHGGILDRFDSLTWAAPAFFYILIVLKSQPPLHPSG
jgi:CDP-diglyceride synthetase